MGGRLDAVRLIQLGLKGRMLTDSFGFGPQLCSGTAPLPAVRTRGREKVREGGGGREFETEWSCLYEVGQLDVC